jgi:hypothetical protein
LQSNANFVTFQVSRVVIKVSGLLLYQDDKCILCHKRQIPESLLTFQLIIKNLKSVRHQNCILNFCLVFLLLSTKQIFITYICVAFPSPYEQNITIKYE